VDVFGDGSVFHTFVNVLSLHGDGTAEQYFTGIPDYMINTGSGTPQFGSWGCRTDGRLVVSFLAAGFQPVAPGTYPLTPYADIEMAFYRRSTYLFKVTDDNTLTRVRARSRGYAPDQDPTDPAGGTLGPITTTPLVYKRLAASDADLLP
jgi:hypothetical protein